MKRILFTIYLTSLCCFSSVMGAIPNTEGLFRNPNNPDLAGNFVETKILFEELSYEGDTQTEKFKSRKVGLLKRYLRLIFSVDKDKRIRTVQIEYDGKKMRDSEISQVIYFPNLLSKLKKDSNLMTCYVFGRLLFGQAVLVSSGVPLARVRAKKIGKSRKNQ